MHKNAEYVWKVSVSVKRLFGYKADHSLTKVFTNKVEALKYVARMEAIGYKAFLQKWFGK